MRTYRFEIKPLTLAADDTVRWNHIVAWRFSDAAFVVPMGYAVPDNERHVRLPEGSKQEGVRDLHCTLLIAGNSVRVDMAADAQVFVDGVAVDDLSWILRAGERCKLRLGQPRGNEDVNPTFQISLLRDAYELPRDPKQRKDIQARLRRGGSIGVANFLWKWRSARRIAFGLLAVAIVILAVSAGWMFFDQADLRAEQKATREQVQSAILSMDKMEKALPFTLDGLGNEDIIRNAIKPVVMVNMRGAEPDLETIQGIGTAWRCCEGSADPEVWVTNQHVVDQLISANAKFGLVPGPAATQASEGSDSSWEQRAFILAGPVQAGNWDNLVAFEPGQTHPDFASMRLVQAARSRFLVEKSLATGSERDDTVNPFDVTSLKPVGPGSDRLQQVVPLALAPMVDIENATSVGQPSLVAGFPFEGPQTTRFNVRSPDLTSKSGYITYQMGPARIRSPVGGNLVLLLDGVPLGGASGSPVLDGQGRVIAITGEGVTTTIQQSFVGAGDDGPVPRSKPVRVPVMGPSVFAYRAEVVHELFSASTGLDRDTDVIRRRERLRLIESQAYATDPRQAELDAVFSQYEVGCPQGDRRVSTEQSVATAGRTRERIELDNKRITGAGDPETFWYDTQIIDAPKSSTSSEADALTSRRALVRVWSEEDEPGPLSLLRHGAVALDRSALDGKQTGGSMVLEPSDAARRVTIISQVGEQAYGLEVTQFWCERTMQGGGGTQ